MGIFVGDPPRSIAHLPWLVRDPIIAAAWRRARYTPVVVKCQTAGPVLMFVAFALFTAGLSNRDMRDSFLWSYTMLQFGGLACVFAGQITIKRPLYRVLHRLMLEKGYRARICYQCESAWEGNMPNFCPNCGANLRQPPDILD